MAQGETNFFSVSFNYLFTGENKNKNSLSTISNSIVDHSSGTITISGTAETKLEPDVKHEINTEQVMSDTSKELLKVFESLPIRERVKLLNMVYEFEEDYRNKEK